MAQGSSGDRRNARHRRRRLDVAARTPDTRLRRITAATTRRHRSFTKRPESRSSSSMFADFDACAEGVKKIEAELGPSRGARQQCGDHPRFDNAPHELRPLERSDPDQPFLVLQHVEGGYNRPRHVEARGKVGLDHCVPMVVAHAVHWKIAGDPRIVDEHLDGTQLGLDLLHPFGAGVEIRNIELEDRYSGLLVKLLCRLVVAAVIRRNLVSGVLERRRDGAADAARFRRSLLLPEPCVPPSFMILASRVRRTSRCPFHRRCTGWRGPSSVAPLHFVQQGDEHPARPKRRSDGRGRWRRH